MGLFFKVFVFGKILQHGFCDFWLYYTVFGKLRGVFTAILYILNYNT